MMIRMLLTAAMLFLIAQPAFSIDTTYSLGGDNSSFFPTNGVIHRPGAITGSLVIREAGAGGPTIREFVVDNTFSSTVGGTATCAGCTGTSVFIDVHLVMSPSFPVQPPGTGDTSTSISFGAIPGWSAIAGSTLTCITTPGGACPTCSACIPFLGFEGPGPPNAAISNTVLNMDPFVFTAGSFTSSVVQPTNLASGAVQALMVVSGTSTGTSAPALGLLGMGAVGILMLGARAAHVRKNRK